ncbi:MAG TPA: hypothetical protein PK079_14285 [Leptospiraceae bacterium]|nr:hypothetical protein [Leptospiraceae bacterium]HMW04186.1 hypothetical protein [Leptospiraceae bacterium]HMX32718.1 hypothetical protein [Leptospiraceae bacterium]HMY30179.1 hypothetical protein [Leptospiraceae bacterium]HMZ65162.1 hypothetical protein [Leptospiraceae bacterium]
MVSLRFFKTSKENFDLKILFYISFICFLISSFGFVFDGRVLNYTPLWLKPLKFAISSLIYSITLIYFVRFIPSERFLVWANKITSYGLILELLIIYFQAARGRMSHFNFLTLEDMVLFQIMAVAIVLVWLAFFIYIKGFFSIPLGRNIFLFSIRMGLIISFLSMPMAFTMTQPSSADLKKIEANKSPIGFTMGSHSVNEKDQTKRLPFTSWSRTGGDLRIAHFLGLHGMQILPLFGMFLFRFRYDYKMGKIIISLLSIIYFSFMVFTLMQALEGVPFIR